MELREYLAILRKYWVSIIAVTIAGLAAGTAASFVQTTPARAQSAVFISVRDGATAREVLGGAAFVTAQVQSYLAVATSPLVLQPVIDQLGLSTTPTDLARDSLEVEVPTYSTIVQISATQKDAALAAGVAQGVAEQLVQAVKTLSPRDADGEPTVVATVTTPAQVVTPEGRGFSMSMARLGLLVGLILGLAQALVRLLLDRSISNAKQAVRAAGHPVLAEIPSAADPRSAEQLDPYRRLRTNLDAALPGQLRRDRSLVVTSAARGEGKTVTALNLATVYATAGQSVLLVDANLHRPRVADELGLDRTGGLTSVLSGEGSLEDAVLPTGNGNLHVLAAGTPTSASADLLSSPGMARLLEAAVHKYDRVVVDTPALAETSEAAAIATLTDRVLLVVASGKATIDSVGDASAILRRAGVDTLGVVLNRGGS
jgi:capsular exopolysaccharide synthesis family protein